MNRSIGFKTGCFVWVVLALVSVAPAQAAGSLLLNGSFEGSFAVQSSSACGPFPNCLGFHNGVWGNDNIGGWQLIGKGGIDGEGQPIPGAPATIMLLGDNYVELNGLTLDPLAFHAKHGVQSIDLTGEGNQGNTNGIKQSVATTPGQDYRLRFWVGHQDGSAPGYTEGPAAVGLYIDGEHVDSFTNSRNKRGDVHWTPFAYKFTASDSQTVLAFLNEASVGNNYTGLDGVTLQQVPEASSLVLLLTGLSVGALGRKK